MFRSRQDSEGRQVRVKRHGRAGAPYPATGVLVSLVNDDGTFGQQFYMVHAVCSFVVRFSWDWR